MVTGWATLYEYTKLALIREFSLPVRPVTHTRQPEVRGALGQNLSVLSVQSLTPQCWQRIKVPSFLVSRSIECTGSSAKANT